MLRWVALALTAVTGFTGLAYEVTWQKYLAILLGAHSEATAAVLGLFLGGLSLGYWVLGALSFVLIRWLGLAGILHALGSANLAVGAAFALLGARPRALAHLDASTAPPLPSGAVVVYGAIALLVGFASMVLQTIAIRVAGLSFG